MDAALVDELARSRCQCLLSVDDSHAGILAAVDRLGLSNNTYFFFTSDHVRTPRLPMPQRSVANATESS